jgi:NADH:ubiquinone oxidoreductase subunit E
MSTSPPSFRKFSIWVCDGPSCGITHESERLVELLERRIGSDADLSSRVSVHNYTCYGRCDDGPNMFVHAVADGEDEDEEPDPDVLDTERGFYPGMNEEKIIRVLEQHCGKGVVLDELVDDY